LRLFLRDISMLLFKYILEIHTKKNNSILLKEEVFFLM